MKKTILILALFLPFILPSCVNHDYDLDEEKIDKNVEFSPDGINFPIGHIDTIWIAEELQKKYNGGENSKIEFDNNYLLYLEYTGNFDFSWQYGLNKINPEIAETNLVADINGILLTGGITLPAGINVPLIQPSEANYSVSDVNLIDQGELTITPKKVNLNNFVVNLSIAFKSITFLTGSDNANLELQVTFPKGFAIVGLPGNTLTKEIPLRDIPNNGDFYSIANINVSSYDYTVEDTKLLYKLSLKTAAPLSVNVNTNPKFELKLDVDNDAIVLSDLECVLNGSKAFSGKVENFDQLYSSFGSKGDILEFIKPHLDFDLATNLSCNFYIDAELDNGIDKAHIEGLKHEKDKNNHFVLSDGGEATIAGSQNFHNLNKVIDVLPQRLDYTIALRFENETATLKPSKGIDLNVDYLLNLPFNFEKVNVTFADKVDLGEDFYSDLFEYATGNISIIADEVLLFVDDNLNVSLSAAILDADNRQILKFDNVLDENRTPNLLITIPKDKTKELENAKYLEFRFELNGQGVDVTRKDYIRINKIRIISDSGIHFEF
ncbi:hypothetical protein AGMMS50262_17550 [Bacteroidia bacterium]|nr:hypothetical protein AGMMS50262_17550 [Bacteroidia bacterium]